MNMRRQLVNTVGQLMTSDSKLVLLLGDIGVFGFKQTFEMFPERVFNIGILEPATISLASGLAKSGLIPIVHTIAPFLVERGFEQLKIDFGYQHHGGNFITVGASYDYASLGCTHHCPGDIALLQTIPGMEIVVPGTAAEFDILFKQAYANGQPTYYRLSEQENPDTQPVNLGQANVVKKGESALVIAVGPALQHVIPAIEGCDVTLLYYSTIAPFDYATLKQCFPASGKVLVVEPFYSGAIAYQIVQAVRPKPVIMDFVGVPHKFLSNYGNAEQHDAAVGLSTENIHSKLRDLIYG